MTDSLRIVLAQLNPIVGDLAGNLDKARSARVQAAVNDADVICFTECFLSGYQQEDLVQKQAFLEDVARHAEMLAADTGDGGPDIIIGAPWVVETGGKPFNSALHLAEGKVQTVRHKHELPNYGVFDDYRVFQRGPPQGPITVRGIRMGVMVCEDMWFPAVTECLEESGAEILVCINGSPFEADKHDLRLQQGIARVTESRLPLIYTNQYGGQDEIVYDGGGFVLNGNASLAVQQPAFADSIIATDWTRGPEGWICAIGARPAVPEGMEGIYSACVVGLRDYVNKNRFPGVVLGLSGGIDSALTAAMSVDALGADRVHCIMLPSVHTSGESLTDARACAEALGVQYDIVEIRSSVDAVEGALGNLFNGREPDVTEENIQSRLRGVMLMAISNKFGSMVVTTGNKSEMAVGYATLYGDMNGGYNPLKDLYKLQVFGLSDWRNQHVPAGALGPGGRVIPRNIITKPPSAELREDQRDDDSLPPYEVLDDILECLVEREMGVPEIVARGHDEAVAKRIEHLLYIAEYKRRQAAPSVKITPRNFGRDRRYPITNAYRDGKYI